MKDILVFCLLNLVYTIQIINRGDDADRIFDTRGIRMDIHDGNIVQWDHLNDGVYYWYGMSYTECPMKKSLIPPRDCGGIYQSFDQEACGFRSDHQISVYTSKDLKYWTYQGQILYIDDRPSGIYFRPKVIYNKKNNNYVLWVNYLAQPSKNCIKCRIFGYSPLMAYPNATYVVAVSETPLGPFKNPRALPSGDGGITQKGGADFDILVYGDEAFIAYGAWGNSVFGDHQIRIERLNADYTDSTGIATQPLTPPSNEAPILFGPYQGWFYLIFGHTCCFCQGGSGANIYYARHPMGPWNDMKLNINPKNQQGEYKIKGQNSFVIKVDKNNQQNTNHLITDEQTTQYIFVSDRWVSAPDGLKAHDFQHWEPLIFENTSNTNYAPRIRELENLIKFSI